MGENKKGLSPTMWLVITIVVALLVALILTMIVNNSATNLGKRTSDSASSSNDGMDIQACQAMCDSCLSASTTNPATCPSWASIMGTKCGPPGNLKTNCP